MTKSTFECVQKCVKNVLFDICVPQIRIFAHIPENDPGIQSCLENPRPWSRPTESQLGREIWNNVSAEGDPSELNDVGIFQATKR